MWDVLTRTPEFKEQNMVFKEQNMVFKEQNMVFKAQGFSCLLHTPNGHPRPKHRGLKSRIWSLKRRVPPVFFTHQMDPPFPPPNTPGQSPPPTGLVSLCFPNVNLLIIT
jgi:hypothetical protein